jgi:hypothetical protein
VVEHSLLAVLDVHAVAPDVPRRQVGTSEAVGANPVEGVLEEVVRGHVEDRDAVRAHDDPVLAPVRPVEDDLVPVRAPDRDVALRRPHDLSAGVGPAGKHDRVTRPCPRDRRLQRRHVLQHPDLRPGVDPACGRRNVHERPAQRREHGEDGRARRRHVQSLASPSARAGGQVSLTVPPWPTVAAPGLSSAWTAAKGESGE